MTSLSNFLPYSLMLAAPQTGMAYKRRKYLLRSTVLSF